MIRFLLIALCLTHAIFAIPPPKEGENNVSGQELIDETIQLQPHNLPERDRWAIAHVSSRSSRHFPIFDPKSVLNSRISKYPQPKRREIKWKLLRFTQPLLVIEDRIKPEDQEFLIDIAKYCHDLRQLGHKTHPIRVQLINVAITDSFQNVVDNARKLCPLNVSTHTLKSSVPGVFYRDGSWIARARGRMQSFSVSEYGFQIAKNMAEAAVSHSFETDF